MTTFQIGEYISSNGGVITAEELAPYLDVENTKEMVLSITCFSIRYRKFVLYHHVSSYAFSYGMISVIDRSESVLKYMVF